MTMLAALKLFLFKWTQQVDIVVGTVIANRNRFEIEPLIGCFINFLAIRSQISEEQTFAEFLEQVKRTVLDAYANQDYPFEKLVEVLNPKRYVSTNPLYNVGFLVQNYPQPPLFHESITAEFLPDDLQTALLDLRFVVCEELSGEITVECEYHTELFEAETIDLLLESYEQFLRTCVQEPEQRISNFALPEALQHKVQQARQRQELRSQMRLHHLGFACRNIEQGIRHVERVYDVKHRSEVAFDPQQNAHVCMIDTNNGLSIVLVAGHEVESLVKQGISLYQICYEVPDIFQSIDEFLAEGATLVSEPKPAALFHNRLVAFLNTPLGLVELLEAAASAFSVDRAKSFASSHQLVQAETIAIAATFTAEPLADAFDFWQHEFHLPVQVRFAPYNQVFQQLLDTSSLLGSNDKGLNVLLLRLEDWFKDDPAELENTVEDFIHAVQGALEGSTVPYLLCLCPASPEKPVHPERSRLFERLETKLLEELADINVLHLVSSAELARLYPVTDYYDLHTDRLGHVPFTPTFFAALGTMIIRRMLAIKREPYKVIVLDCDNTLWNGVCGEDGALGVRIEPPYCALQKFMLKQRETGMLLCVCSKNNEQDVVAVFENHPDMVMKREHLAAHRINWQPKSENLISLAQELNLGLDSIIFVDDNPLECAEVEANCPEVLTLQLPLQPESIPQFLEHIWAFDHLKITTEDRQRSLLYQQHVRREQARRASLTLQDFLDQLDMKIAIHQPDAAQFPRAAQLTQRTNQFNLTTIRRSESELRAVCSKEGYECLVTEVSDRFGNYGLVGLALFNVNTEAICVDTFLLSCRALGRGVEHRMLAQLGQLACERHLQRVEMFYVPTAKNQPALDFLEYAGQSEKEEQGEGWVFRFPAEAAAAVTFHPKELEGGKESTTGMRRRRRKESGELLSRIALELHDAGQILAAISADRHRARPELDAQFVAPRTPTEDTLAAIWGDVLELDTVGVYDDFFELGGHSLLATQILSRIIERFQLNLPLQILLQNPTIAGIAEQIETIRWAAKPPQEGMSAPDEEREEGEL